MLYGHMQSGLKFSILVVIVLLFADRATSQASGSNVKEVKIAGGQTVDLWFGVNVKGKVHYAIRTRDGSNQLRAWWIMEPLGNVKQLGDLKNSGSINIPDKLDGSITAKLRGKAAVDTVVYLGENIQVANSVTFHW